MKYSDRQGGAFGCYSILFLVEGNKIDLKPFKGNVCLLNLVHGNALS